MDRELRIEAKARNNVLQQAIMQLWPSVAKFCTEFGFHSSHVGKLINLKLNPIGARGDYRPICRRLAETLGFSCEELFPLWLYEIKDPVRVYDYSQEQLGDFGFSPQRLPDPEQTLVKQELRLCLDEVLCKLNSRNAEIIRRYFSFEDESHASQILAQEFEITQTRVNQIVRQSLRKLRHVKCSKQLKPFIEC